MGWALHVLTIATAVQGRLTDALPLFDRALTVTESDPALTDLRLLLQINQAVTLGCLDQYAQAFAAARQARDHADRVGTTVRLAQAHSALSQMLFETGRWDEALAEVQAVPEGLNETNAACIAFSIAAVIGFHRGQTDAARNRLAAAVPHAKKLGNRALSQLALARSLDYEQAGALPEALAALTAGFANSTEDLGEIEDVLPAAVRLATQTRDLNTAQALAGHATALAAGSDVPHRQANALYCRGLLYQDAPRLLAAAERYDHASLAAAEGDGARGGRRELRGHRRPRSGPGGVHSCRGDLHRSGRGRRPGPGTGHLPRPRHPTRPARQAPACDRQLTARHRRTQRIVSIVLVKIEMERGHQ